MLTLPRRPRPGGPLDLQKVIDRLNKIIVPSQPVNPRNRKARVTLGDSRVEGQRLPAGGGQEVAEQLTRRHGLDLVPGLQVGGGFPLLLADSLRNAL